MELNTELLTKISDWLKAGAPEDQAHGFRFNMWQWLEIETRENDRGWCGTACCIAGAALVFGDFEMVDTTAQVEAEGFAEGQPLHIFDDHTSTLAAEALGLTQRQADHLFEPWGFFDIPTNPTPAEAAEVIDRLIATGEVTW